MKHILLIFGVLFTLNLSAQTLRVRVLNAKGEPVQSASVFVKQTLQGVITNDSGEFELKLAGGNYDLEIRCLGYETQNMRIIVKDTDIEQIIRLKEVAFLLKEVVATAGEDPAYEIMRQAIKKAPYYRNVIKSSVYEAYTKGSGKMTDTPDLLLKIAGKEAQKEVDLMRNKLFLLESFCEIKFTAPNTYEQNIKAFSSSFPMMDDPKNAMFAGMYSLYSPQFAAAVSPLNAKAFEYYRFRYEGFEQDGGQTLNKIRVIPKLKDARFLEGMLYIADNVWDIRYAEVKISLMGMSFFYRLNYHNVGQNIYAVTDYQVDFDADLMGLKFKGTLLSSMQFSDIQFNDSLIAVEKSNKKTAKVKVKKERQSLELKEENWLKQEVDTLANRRDSAYWGELRTIVLTDEELQSYARRDTLEQHIDSLEKADKNPKFSFSDLIVGSRFGNDSSLMYFSYSGLLGALHDYNYVDGFVLGQRFSLDFKNRRGKHFVVSPSAYWAAARKTLIWNVDADFHYAPRCLGLLSFQIGRNSDDYSGSEGMGRFLNADYSVLYGRNYAKFYDKQQITLTNTIDIANGLNFGVGMKLAKRQALANHTTWNIFGIKDKWTENAPNYQNTLNGQFSDLAKFSVQLAYTPEYFYKIRDGIYKEYAHSRFPTFTLDYQCGMKLFDNFATENSASVFNRLEFSVNQSIKLNLFSRLNYKISAGKFFNKNDFNYIDYKHFGTGGGLLFSIKNLNDNFVLLPFYSYSTNTQWVEAFVNFSSDYILLKRLPFLQGKIFGEALHVKFLHTPEKPLYSELGYSFGLGGIASGGVFAAFDKVKFNSVGFQISIPVFNIFSRKNRGGTITISTAGMNVEMK